MTVDLLCGDVLTTEPGGLSHAMLCDPPYALHFMNRAWDDDIAFRPETWARLGEHLHPGAFGMAFASSRGWHRMACAIEDAGFIIHPTIFCWAFGCLSEDTEILTADGWKSYHRNLHGSMVMCYNVNDGTFDYMPVQEVYDYEYDDTAYSIRSDRTDQIVSRNHRCLIERGGSLVFQQAEALECQEIVPVLEIVPELREAVQRRKRGPVSQKASLFPRVRDRGGANQATGQASTVWPTEESTSTDTTNRSNLLSVRQGVHNTCGMGEEIRAALLQSQLSRKTGCLRTRHGGNSITRTCWLDRDKHGRISREDERAEQSRVEGRSNLLSEARQLCANQVCALSSGVPADGPEGWLRDGASADCGATPGALPEAFGSGASCEPRPAGQSALQSGTVRQQYGAQEVRGDWRTATTLATVTPIHYTGRVWCVRVPTGAFVARRNGRVFITGNSGFPKATRIDTQVDKAAGAERPDKLIGGHIGMGIAEGNRARHELTDSGRVPAVIGKGLLTNGTPITPLAATWAGHRYGLQALKPAVEPIIVFQKPHVGKPVDCITATGAGALNIEAGRIAGAAGDGVWGTSNATCAPTFNGSPGQHEYRSAQHPAGRWPANFILGDDAAADALDRQSGELPAGRAIRHRSGGNTFGGDNPKPPMDDMGYRDTGGCSRFFYRVSAALDEAEPVRYVAKASRRERDAGLDGYLTVKYNVAILDFGGVPCQSVAMATAALLQRVMSESTRNLSIVACGESIMARCQKGGLSTTLMAIRKTIESRILPLLTLSLTNESIADANSLMESGGSHAESVESLRGWILTTTGGGMELARGVSLAASEMLLTISESGAWQEWKSNHPTHKPIDLCRYLATLLLPPAEYAPRRILIPFAGVGSECIGAALAGWDEVVGIEREAEYVEIGRARIAHWCAQPALLEVSA